MKKYSPCIPQGEKCPLFGCLDIFQTGVVRDRGSGIFRVFGYVQLPVAEVSREADSVPRGIALVFWQGGKADVV